MDRPASDPFVALHSVWSQACSSVGNLTQHVSQEFSRGAQRIHMTSARLFGELHGLSQRRPMQQPLFAVREIVLKSTRICDRQTNCLLLLQPAHISHRYTCIAFRMATTRSPADRHSLADGGPTPFL